MTEWRPGCFAREGETTIVDGQPFVLHDGRWCMVWPNLAGSADGFADVPPLLRSFPVGQSSWMPTSGPAGTKTKFL